MAEEFNEQPTQPFEIERYLDIVQRRHVFFLTILLLVWAIVWGSSWVLPVRYKSQTLILVEEPTMPKNYVVPNVNDDIQNRLQSITQQILSRTRLLMIIDKLHLYQNARPGTTPDSLVERMRKDIEVELVRDSHNEITAFKVYYSAPDPHTAQLVTSELTNLFISENLKVRAQASENTTAFIRSQLEIARANLADQDAKVRAFRASHMGELPTQEASNLQILSGLQAQLQSEQDALNAANQQSTYHQSMIEQYHALQGSTQSAGGGNDGLSAVENRLEALKTKLQNLKTRYTDQYPEVQEVRSEIAEAEKAKATLVAKLKKSGSTEDSAQGMANSPQRAPLLQLQGQLRADEAEIANRKQAISSLKARINDYQARLNSQPAVEQQMADLTRGYEQSQTNYNELLKKENDSQMATSMEQMQQGERFTMLDPPTLPTKPDFPNRLKMCGVGLGGGLLLGLLVVAIFEFFDDRLHSDQEIEKLLTISVISEIPEIITQDDEKRNKGKIMCGWAMAALVMCIILAGSAFSYLHF